MKDNKKIARAWVATTTKRRDGWHGLCVNTITHQRLVGPVEKNEAHALAWCHGKSAKKQMSWLVSGYKSNPRRRRSKKKYVRRNKRRNPRSKHLPRCSAHHMTFGGHCLNCGLGAPKYRKKSKASRKLYLKSLGFKFPKRSRRSRK